jgi:hypothetical protein
MTATPLCASVAESATLTDAVYQPVEQVEPSHRIDETGAVGSIRISCEFVASTLPALSQA